MSKVISLMDILPVYKHMGKEDHKQVERDAKWLDDQKKLGQKGENIVKAFLEGKYRAKVLVEPDYRGYDFSVKLANREFVVEVKTTKGNENRFFISRNELQCAEKMGNLYNLYYVILENNIGKLYVINNPIDTFNIDKKIIYNNIINNKIVEAHIEGLIVVVDGDQLENFFATEINIVDTDNLEHWHGYL